MTTLGPFGGEHQIPHHTIRNAHIVGDDGERSVLATVYCPLRERSATVRECESCRRFQALHFDKTSRTTSVVCHADQAAPGAGEADPLRKAGVDVPVDPETPLAEIMTRDVICVRPEVALDDITALLVRYEISGMPVVDAAGRPVGMVSRADVLRAADERGDTEESQRVTSRSGELAPLEMEHGFHVLEPVRITARDVMTPVVVQLHESASIRQAASLMAYESVHRLPVVSDDGKVVGILSSLDVLRWFGRCCGYLIPPARKRA
ncbi:CBS domain-containing protein [Sorangium sp. So ce1000]|uniref:CBS domain-containing protein n=1 Tax=Sorangium sp. So ce1000 TaxID=3133325 RepID=UPI003F645362